MHSNVITHRNIKLENLLFIKDSNNNIDKIQLTDFGSSCYNNDKFATNKPYGTSDYTVPELINYNKHKKNSSKI